MNKIYLSLIILMTSIYACAQDSDDTKGSISYGVKAGGHVTSNLGPGTQHYSVKPFLGFHGGVFAKYGLTEKISLQQEILVTGRGIRTQYASSSNQQFGELGVSYSQPNFLTPETSTQRAVTTQTDVYYLDLPLSVHYKLIPKVSAHIGAMYSAYLFRTKLSNTYSLGEKENIKEPDTNHLQPTASRSDLESFEKHQLGAFVGGAYHFDFGLQAGARYNLGLTRINKPVRGGRDLQYTMIQVFVAYDLSRLF